MSMSSAASRLLFSASSGRLLLRGLGARISPLSPLATRKAHFLDGVTMLDKTGQIVKARSLKNKTLALYFAAGWSPECRIFAPKMQDFYNATKGKKGFEVLWVPRESEEEELMDTYERFMPDCLYLPVGSRYINEFIYEYTVNDLPMVRVVDTEGVVLVEDAKEKIETEGSEDPAKLFNEWQALNKKKNDESKKRTKKKNKSSES